MQLNTDFETDEAEIKAFMRPQRVREAESRMEMQFAKWTAEGAQNGSCSVCCDVLTYVSCRKYVSISQRVWIFHKARWHRGLID